MTGRRFAGFTLIEMLLAIVIIGIGVAGVLMAFSATVRNSADPIVTKQLLAIAEEMMEEIELKPYAPVADTETSSGCSRMAFNDVSDYSGYTNKAICSIDGTAISSLAGYTVSVVIAAGTMSGAPVKQITVTAKYGSSNSLVLVGWRAGYAP